MACRFASSAVIGGGIPEFNPRTRSPPVFTFGSVFFAGGFFMLGVAESGKGISLAAAGALDFALEALGAVPLVGGLAPLGCCSALGGGLGAISVATRHELVLAITGGLFVVETVSVILQVASFKLTGKRIFLMAPLHHHFEKKGWAEPTIVIRFWIISVVLAVAGLSSLKLR